MYAPIIGARIPPKATKIAAFLLLFKSFKSVSRPAKTISLVEES